jgi:hypothetical protein
VAERSNAAVLKTPPLDALGCTALHLRHNMAHRCMQRQGHAAALLPKLLPLGIW